MTAFFSRKLPAKKEIHDGKANNSYLKIASEPFDPSDTINNTFSIARPIECRN